MGIFRIINRDQRYHLTVHNAVKDFVKTVEYDLRMYVNVPGWERQAIQVRQAQTVAQVQKKHGPEAAQKVQAILDRRIPALDLLWQQADQDRRDLADAVVDDDPAL